MNRHTRTHKRPFLVTLGVIILLVAILTALELTDTTHLFHVSTKSGTIPSKHPSLSTGKPTKTTTPSSNTLTAPSNNSSSSTGSTASGPAPLVPTGDFVSNHHPGGSAPTSEASTCNTTPGASCYIQFTQGSVVKKLGTQIANADGGVIWYWDVKSAGLSPGSWKITAVATLNGQTRTTDDAMSLEVQ